MSTKKPSATNAGEIAKVIENIVPKKIKVVCRCCHTIESKDDSETTKSDLMDLQEIYDCAGKCARQTACKFDTLLDKTSTQEQVFKQISPVVDGVLAGHNGSVVVFGQPGSGKTFTLEGDKDSAEEKGLIFRSIDKLYDDIKAAEPTATYVVSASYHEIFPDESTRDLLNLKQKTGSRPTDLVGLSKTELMAAVNGGAVNHKRGQYNADVQPHTILRIKVQKTALAEPTPAGTPVKPTNGASNKSASASAKPAPIVPTAPLAPQDSNLFFVKLGSVNGNTETREKELLKRREFKSLLLLGVAVDSQRQFGKTMNLNSPLTTALKGSLGEDGGQAVLIACCNRIEDTKVSQPIEKASSLRSVEAKPPTDTHTLAAFADLKARCRTGADDNAQLKLELIRLQKAEKSEENELQDLKTALAAGKAISDTREETLQKATAELDELKIAGKKDAVRAAQYAEEIKVLKAELKELNQYMSQANRCLVLTAEKEEKHVQKQIDNETLLKEICAKKDKLQSAVCEAAKKLQDVSVEKDKILTELEGEKKCHGHEEKKDELPSNPHVLRPERDPCHQSTPIKTDATEEDGIKPDSPSDNHHLEHLEQHDCAAHNTYDLTVLNFAPQPAGSSAAGEGEPRTLCVYQRHATEDNLLRPVAWLVESDGITKHFPASYNGKTVVPAHTTTRFKWQDTCAVFLEELSYFSKFGSFEFKPPTEGEVVSRTVGANLSLQVGEDGEISLLHEGEGDPGKYRVKVGDLPSDNRVVLGVSTAGAPSAVVEVFPNMNYRLDADVEYYVAYDVFTKGVVIGDRERSLNATRLHFPKHVKGHSTLTVKLHAHHTAK